MEMISAEAPKEDISQAVKSENEEEYEDNNCDVEKLAEGEGENPRLPDNNIAVVDTGVYSLTREKLTDIDGEGAGLSDNNVAVADEGGVYSLMREKKRIACPHCDKTFTQVGSLQTHMRVHTGDRPYVCKECGKTFTQLGSLQLHYRTHTGERPFECEDCGKKFTQKVSLQVHERTHTGEKPFACCFCDRSFSQRGSLQTHLRTHTGDRPYECAYCEKRFSQRASLHAHVRTHTGERPFRCLECGESFTQHSSLKVHCIKYHRTAESRQMALSDGGGQATFLLTDGSSFPMQPEFSALTGPPLPFRQGFVPTSVEVPWGPPGYVHGELRASGSGGSNAAANGGNGSNGSVNGTDSGTVNQARGAVVVNRSENVDSGTMDDSKTTVVVGRAEKSDIRGGLDEAVHTASPSSLECSSSEDECVGTTYLCVECGGTYGTFAQLTTHQKKHASAADVPSAAEAVLPLPVRSHQSELDEDSGDVDPDDFSE